jgi:aspartokinase
MGNNEIAKLRTILHYWIEHNKEHSQEFSQWADRIAALGEIETAKWLRQAAQEMDKASKSLSKALRSLGKGGR